MEIQGTEQQLSFGIALASFFLAMQIVGEAVKRDRIKMEDATALFADARETLNEGGALFPCDPAVKKIANNLLLMVERMTGAQSAETPGSGRH
jgi:hypothetical protein